MTKEIRSSCVTLSILVCLGVLPGRCRSTPNMFGELKSPFERQINAQGDESNEENYNCPGVGSSKDCLRNIDRSPWSSQAKRCLYRWGSSWAICDVHSWQIKGHISGKSNVSLLVFKVCQQLTEIQVPLSLILILVNEFFAVQPPSQSEAFSWYTQLNQGTAILVHIFRQASLKILVSGAFQQF